MNVHGEPTLAVGDVVFVYHCYALPWSTENVIDDFDIESIVNASSECESVELFFGTLCIVVAMSRQTEYSSFGSYGVITSHGVKCVINETDIHVRVVT